MGRGSKRLRVRGSLSWDIVADLTHRLEQSAALRSAGVRPRRLIVAGRAIMEASEGGDLFAELDHPRHQVLRLIAQSAQRRPVR